MGKAFLKFANTANPDWLIITWAEFASPLAEIGRMAYAYPHPERSLTVDNVNPVMHRFSFYQSNDGVTLGTFQMALDIDCGIVQSVFELYDYVVGRGGGSSIPGESWNDPADQDDEMIDERLINTEWWLEKRGVAKLRPDEYTKDPATGKSTLIGSVFEEEDTYFAVVKKGVVQQTSGAPSSDFMEEYVLSESDDLAPAMYRKIINVTSSEVVTTLAVQSLSTVPKTKIKISTHEMAGRYLTIAFSGSDQVKFIGLNRGKITLGKGETIELLFTGSKCIVCDYKGDYYRLGTLSWGRGIESNVVSLDGTLYNIADMPRLYIDYVNRLPTNQIVTMSAWETPQTIDSITEYPNKGFFAVDTIAGTFRVPDYRNRFIRALKLSTSADPLRVNDIAGGFQMDMVGPHTHPIPNGNSYAGSAIATKVGKGNNNPSFVNSSANNGTETITRNIGLIPQIII